MSRRRQIGADPVWEREATGVVQDQTEKLPSLEDGPAGRQEEEIA